MKPNESINEVIKELGCNPNDYYCFTDEENNIYLVKHNGKTVFDVLNYLRQHFFNGFHMMSKLKKVSLKSMKNAVAYMKKSGCELIEKGHSPITDNLINYIQEYGLKDSEGYFELEYSDKELEDCYGYIRCVNKDPKNKNIFFSIKDLETYFYDHEFVYREKKEDDFSVDSTINFTLEEALGQAGMFGAEFNLYKGDVLYFYLDWVSDDYEIPTSLEILPLKEHIEDFHFIESKNAVYCRIPCKNNENLKL